MYIVLRLQIDPHMEIIVEGKYKSDTEATKRRLDLMKEHGVFCHIQVEKV
jgi:hypothetical protein